MAICKRSKQGKIGNYLLLWRYYHKQKLSKLKHRKPFIYRKKIHKFKKTKNFKFKKKKKEIS